MGFGVSGQDFLQGANQLWLIDLSKTVVLNE